MKLISFLIRYTFRYLRYFFRAYTRYDLHSPFVADFIKNTLEDRRWYYVFDQIQQLKQKLALNDDPVKVVDYGAGSQLGKRLTIPVNSIAQYSAISPFSGRLLFRIVQFLQPATLLELGTSLGISAIYQMAPRRRAQMITIEGNPEVAALARQNLQEAGLEHVKVLEGPFKEVLPKIIASRISFDFFHFDGDHRLQPTLEYFEQCLGLSNVNSVFCIGDIYWSAEMEQAWKQLKEHPRVRLSIDLFHFGLLFLRPEQREKEDFTVIACRWKPWRMGFW